MEIIMSDLYKRYLETDLLREKIINVYKEKNVSISGVCKLLDLNVNKMGWIFSRLEINEYLIRSKEKKICPVLNKKLILLQWTGKEFNIKTIDEIVSMYSFRAANAANKRDEFKIGNGSEIIKHPNSRIIRLLDRERDWKNPNKKYKTNVAIGSSFYLMDFA
jgi:DNA-binding transcriptional MerR regulator